MKRITLFFALMSVTISAQSWNLSGNSGTNPTTNFIGTSDAQPLILKTNNVERLNLGSDGRLVLKTSDGLGGISLTLDGGNGIGLFQIGKSGCDGCWGVSKGETVFRNLSGPHSMTFQLPNDNNDGTSFFGFNDVHNGTWVKIFNNATARFNGKIYAKEVEVKANVWADYVFKNDYRLPSLEEVEDYINNNGHLPNIPSEKMILENGINIAEMDARLLAKIEELTLYSIEQNKQIKLLQEQNRILKMQVDKIEDIEQKLQKVLSDN